MSTERRRRAPVADGLFLVGLVGRAGSGKTTVAEALRLEGAVVVDADALGHEVTDQDPQVRAALVAEYGPDVYTGDGRLDRRRVAARVFTDPEARARLDRLVHPRIVERIRQRFELLRSTSYHGVVVVDAALMLDWGLERELDAVVAVVAPEEQQIARLRAGRNWSEAEARARLGVQRTHERFALAADVTLENTGGIDDLRAAARAAVARLRAENEARAAGETGGKGC